MKLLLDTHVLLWALLEPEKLSLELRNSLEDSDNTLVVSAASDWEIATKWRLGKLRHARSVVENYAMAPASSRGGRSADQWCRGPSGRPLGCAAPRSLRSPAGGPGHG
jgi:hypothetical protein